MKRAILAAISAAAAIASAAPALAQPFFGHPPVVETRFGGGDVDGRIGQLGFRLDQAQRRGLIDWREAQRLRGELNAIRWMERRDRFQNGGYMNGAQRAQLEGRLNRVDAQLDGRAFVRPDHVWDAHR